MSRNAPPRLSPSRQPGAERHPPARPASTAGVLSRAAQLLQEGHPQAALDLLNGAAATDPLVQNARGVCQMRLGRAHEAVALYRQLTLRDNGLNLDLARPTVFITNFATALLLDRNVKGCTTVLLELRQDELPVVVRLRACIARWRESLPWWPRMMFAAYGEVRRPVELDFAPGELLLPDAEVSPRIHGAPPP